MAGKKRPTVAPGLPKREEVLSFLQDNPGKVGKREIARAFGLKGSDKIGLKKLLRDLADDGLITSRRADIRRVGTLPNVTVLRIQSVDDDGRLIAVPDEWAEADGPLPRIVVEQDHGRSRRPTAEAGPGDRVLARIKRDRTEVHDRHQGGHERTARIMKVLQKKKDAALGILRRSGNTLRVIPVDRRGKEMTVSDAHLNDAQDGELVRVEPLDQTRLGPPAGRIVERIGDVSSESAISLIALEEHGIPYRFSDQVLAEAEKAGPADMKSREDWRALPLITIDPSDARDHDDAVHAAPDPGVEGGHIVTVAIADVSTYVGPGSHLDREARRRGNSVYFPGRVVPMLPERISNDLCSLRAEVDRPALAVRMTFDASGHKTGHSFHRVMMRSIAALSYQEAQSIIDESEDKGSHEKTVVEAVLNLNAAYLVLARGRDARAPLDLEIPERKVVLADGGTVDAVVVPPRLATHRLIEEFMIQANVAAAETLEERRATLVYRIHDEPSWEKMEALREFLGSLDINLAKSGALRAELFNRILGRAKSSPNAVLVNEMVLRSQSQAEYATQNIGHFGLNLRRYAHFTSPIRRYADLIVHRALIKALKLGPGGLTPGEEKQMDKIASEISGAERRAMAAERDTVDRLIALWLADRVGARFAARIRGVTRSGLFVELDETGADGFVPISTLGNDYYHFDEARHRVVGSDSGESFSLGDEVMVVLVEALPFAGSLRFEIESGGKVLPAAERRAVTRHGNRDRHRSGRGPARRSGKSRKKEKGRTR